MRYFFLILLGFLLVVSTSNNGVKDNEISKRKLTQPNSKLPLSFIKNEGQINKSVCYYVKQPLQTIYLSKDAIVFDLFKLDSDEISERLSFSYRPIGTNKDAEITGFDEQPGKINYLRGNDPSKWKTNIRTYKGIVYKNIYDGIDLKVYGNGKALETEYIVEPHADPSKIVIKYEGIKGLKVNEDGDLIIDTAFGSLMESRSRVYQEKNGKQIHVKASYRIISEDICTFALADYDKKSQLVIDPTIIYSTYLGGNSGDAAYGVAVDSTSACYVTGTTHSYDFPGIELATPSVYGKSNEVSGSTLYVYPSFTFLPANPTINETIAFDASPTTISPGVSVRYYAWWFGDGTPYVYSDKVTHVYKSAGTFTVLLVVSYYYSGGDLGDLDATAFALATITVGPTTVSPLDVFVSKINPEGSAIVYSTYFGETDSDIGRAIAVDSEGACYVAVQTRGGNVAAAKISPDGSSLIYFMGVAGGWCSGIAVDSKGACYVTGTGWASNNSNVYITKINPEGSALIYSISLGGSSNEFGTYYQSIRYKGGYLNIGGVGTTTIAVDSTGACYVAGTTYSHDFPTVSAIDNSFNGGSDAFVTKIDPNGSVVFSTYLGGSEYEHAYAIAVDSEGACYVAGTTGSPDFPLVSAYDSILDGTIGIPPVPVFGGGVKFSLLANVVANKDAFVTKINPQGSAIIYSTFLGGSDADCATAIAVDPTGSCYVGGYTWSWDFPTVLAFDNSYDGYADGFITKFSPEGSNLVYSTYIGGSASVSTTMGVLLAGDVVTSMAVDSKGGCYLTGFTFSSDFPTASAIDATFGGGYMDAFVMKLINFFIQPDFLYSPLEPEIHENIFFDASSTESSGCTITYYRWDFGDGRNARGITTDHRYSKEGSYTVTLYVGYVDFVRKQGEATISKTVTVYPRETGEGSYVDLVKRAAWPEHQWTLLKGEDGITLYARVHNFSTKQTFNVKVRFIVSGQPGTNNTYTLWTDIIDLQTGETRVVSVSRAFPPGMYLVTAQAFYSLDSIIWTGGKRIKRFGFPVLQ